MSRFDIALIIDEFQPVLKLHQEMIERAAELADHMAILNAASQRLELDSRW